MAFLNSELAVLLSETTYNWVNTKFHKLTFSVLYSCSHSTISVQKPLAQQRWHLILQQTPGSWLLVPPRPRTRTANTSLLATPPPFLDSDSKHLVPGSTPGLVYCHAHCFYNLLCQRFVSIHNIDKNTVSHMNITHVDHIWNHTLTRT